MPLTAILSHGTLHLPFHRIGMLSAAASILEATKFSCSLFEVCISDVSWRVSVLFLSLTYIDYFIVIVYGGVVITGSLNCRTVSSAILCKLQDSGLKVKEVRIPGVPLRSILAFGNVWIPWLRFKSNYIRSAWRRVLSLNHPQRLTY